MSSKVNVTALGFVRHDNKDFKPGDKIPGLSVEDVERLKGLGVVKVEAIVDPPKEPDPPDDPEKDDKKGKK